MTDKTISLVIVCVMYAAVVIFPRKKAYFTLAAAALVILTGIITPFRAVAGHINWSILMIYIGSLAIAELFIYSRVPARIADNIVNW
ncbi:MAG: citrate transporter, partial [Spirochaetaceae bacterium]|nr:citrate transporter [Spirochaetaceae bacterium]